MKNNKKNPFDDLPQDFKDAMENMSDEEIKQAMANVAISEQQNQDAKRDDQDLAEKLEAAKFAGEGYREASKMNKLKIKYGYSILDGRGKIPS